MTQSPPQASSSSRPPPPAAAPGADSGRRVTALAAGGSVLLVCSAAVALWPRTYGSQATFVVDGGIPVDKQMAVASRIEGALLERDVLAAAAMDLPPELRSPDPIGKLRAGIRVQSRGASGFVVEFRGSDPQSVQRIANRLVDRAVAILPKVAAGPAQPPSPNVLVLAERTRAVTEFLTAHPEMTLEPSSNPSPSAATSDSGLDALRTEKRLLETRLTTSGNDNPYNEPNQDPAVLARRVEELKTTIQRREAALKRPRATAPAVSPELTAQWRTLLADLANAQASASQPIPEAPAVTGHVTARASLPGSPLTPNRLVLSLVAALLSVAAAMVAYVLPRKPAARSAGASGPNPRPRSDPPPAKRSDPPPAPRNESELAFAATGLAPQYGPGAPPRTPSDPPPRQSSSRPPPQLGPSPSQPPPAIAAQRTVVLGPSGSGSSPPPARQRSSTSPGGILAPASYPPPAAVPGPQAPAHSPPAPPLFGSRPPPGAGSYSVSSSHPPAADGGQRPSSVERLSPLQSAHPPMQASAGATRTQSDPSAPQIVSRPPALDPEAEKWAARFETVPPPPGPAPEPEQVPRRKRSGRWKTQAMGSMVPIEVSQAREERAPYSDPMSSERPEQRPEPAVFVHYDQPPQPAASNIAFNDVPSGWRPTVDPGESAILVIRDAVLQHPPVKHLSIAVTGPRAAQRARLAGALSIALAQSGVRVLLLEADFESPQVHQVMSIAAAPGAGFSQQLLARRGGGQAKPWTVVRAAPTLHVLAEGRLRSPGVVAAVDFERAFAELRDQHQVVIVHAPPLERMAELMAFNHLVQCSVVANVTGLPSVRFGEGPLRNLA